MSDNAVRHPTRVTAQSGLRLLTFAIHQHAQLFRVLTNTLAQLANETRGHVRIRLECRAAAMREELADLESAVTWAEQASAPKTVEAPNESATDTTRDGSIK